MANPFVQYLKETRTELNHVAWPTQKQTVVYTVLVAAISIGIAVYLGFFDYVFHIALSDLLTLQSAASTIQVTQEPAASSSSSTTQTPITTGPTFTITPSTGSTNSTK